MSSTAQARGVARAQAGDMTDTTSPESAVHPRRPSSTGTPRELWPELALAWSSLLLFVVAVVLTVRATENAWDVEARFALAPEADQSLYGLAYLVYAFVLAPAAVAHLVAVVLSSCRALRGRPAGGAGWVVAWVAYALGVITIGSVGAIGVDFVLGLDGVPRDARDRALFLHAAPLLVAAIGGMVPFVWSRRARRDL